MAVKTSALNVADFDGDQNLGKEDLEQVINAITRNALSADEVNYIYDMVFVTFTVLHHL